jgi:TolA-binding protein
MRRFFVLALCALLLQATPVFSQSSEVYTHGLKDYDRAVQLYQEKQYQAAQILFKKVKDANPSYEVESDCAYFIANCAIRLNQAHGDVMMESFVENYPTSSKHNQAYMEVGKYYFDEGKFPQALQWFDKVEENQLTQAEKEQFNFQKGYAMFSGNRKKEAANYFNRVVNSKEFGSQAKYYLGYMSYESDNYQEANQYFEQVADEQKYKEKMSYYQADMNFKLGNFQKAIDLGVTAMAKSDAQEKSELNKIIGESYFNLNQYDKAIPYLTQYKGRKGKWTNTDFYLLGYAYYKQKDFENAIAQFNKIIDGKDHVAQNAYYHLGESYLNTNRKQQALNAFKNASEMNFDVKIQEDAFYNYAKLSYEIGNPYQSVPDVMTTFLKKYPNTPYKQEMETLLIDSYISSKNYKEALSLLEKNKTPENKAAYQKVTFYRGLELYIDGNYQEALSMFKKSLAEPRDARFTARATFWKGELEFQLDQFNEAVLSFKQFMGMSEASKTPEFKNSHYHLAYALFKLKDYDQAATHFQSHIDKVKDDKTRLNDSYLRLGDSYFVSAKYWPAMEAYNKAIELKAPDSDYAAFQKALSYGFVSRNEKKIEDLNSFLKNYPKSQYRDDALFELGNTYTNDNKTDLALKTYDQLISEFKNSSFTARAILRQGLIYYNTDKSQLALTKFKKVAAEFPKTTEALEAVSTARQIYVDTGRVNEYADWVKTLDYVEVSNADLDNTTYESAEKMYLQNKSKEAISGFSGYISRFPNGLHALKANFYLAQLYFADGLETNAISHYEFVVSKSRSEYTEQALARLSEIHLKQKNDAKAIAVLKRLEAEADFPQNITFAQSNLMKVYYESKDYTNTVLYAEKVLANAKTEERVKNDARMMIARSAFKTGDEAKAKNFYAQILPTAKGELAAEAHYFDAYFKNKEGKFEASNTAVQKLAKDFSGYKYYGAKGLVVMAKNFYGLKDSFQATYILESVISNFTEFTDVVEEAQKELAIIKAEEAKRNSSIQN